MSLLKDILYKVSIRTVEGSTDVDIKDIQIDSRKIKPGSVFVAVRGVAADGHQFIEKAIENGATVVKQLLQHYYISSLHRWDMNVDC